MKDKSLQGFLNLYGSEHGKRAEYMMIKVQNGNAAPEVIVNPRVNFESKMKYYQVAYDENLVLKNNPDIKIVDFDFFEYLSDLVEVF